MFVIVSTVVATLALLGVLVALVRTVRSDGLGHRPPPPCRPREAGSRTW